MTKLRQIMYEPSSCWLSTENSGDRWLTDQYVLLDVTEYEEFQDLPDGAYKLTASNGPQERVAAPQPNIETYFEKIFEGPWNPAYPTEWSVAEHPGKAMLWVSDGKPKLIGEPTWTQIKRHYPDVEVEVSNKLFRFSLEGVPFCYAAGIKIPDGQHLVAHAIAMTLDETADIVYT